MNDHIPVNLHWRELSDRGPTAILLHGLFGSGDNLAGLGAALTDAYRVVLVDLRNHGRSGWSDILTLPAMAADIAALLDKRDLGPAVVIGHSLGGKVAMQLALASPERVSAVVVADIAPVQYPPHHQAIFAGLDAVALDRVSRRADADAMLAEYVAEPMVRGFLLKSLAVEAGAMGSEAGNRFQWRFNWRALQRGYDHLNAVPEGDAFQGPALFIKGGRSDYILPDYEPALRQRFPHATLRTIADAGHWLHAEQPDVFNALVRDFLLPLDR